MDKLEKLQAAYNLHMEGLGLIVLTADDGIKATPDRANSFLAAIINIAEKIGDDVEALMSGVIEFEHKEVQKKSPRDGNLESDT